MHNKYIHFKYHPAKAARVWAEHGIDFADCEMVFYDNNAPPAIEDGWHEGERRWIVLGMSAIAELVLVCYTMPDDATVRLISARKASKGERYGYGQGF